MNNLGIKLFCGEERSNVLKYGLVFPKLRVSAKARWQKN